MIEQLELTKFTVFDQLDIRFSPKINIIIGENGTGKTHILKAAYAMDASRRIYKQKMELSKEEFATLLSQKLIRTFLPLDEKLGNLRQSKATKKAQFSVYFAGGEYVETSFSQKANNVKVDKWDMYEPSSEPVFIPTKEVLSFMKGFTSLYERYDLSFDQTYVDICSLLDLPEIRPEALQAKSKWAMEEIEKVCGGKFVFYGGGKVTFMTNQTEYSANAMAEGLRKIGILSRLLETGAIQPGISGPLFWDEPEANINPKLRRILVEILLELSRNGQQIIIATHDYFFLKWFELLMDTGKDDQVRYHALYRDEASGEIKVESTDDYHQINPNSIAETFSDLTDYEIARSMGGLGK